MAGTATLLRVCIKDNTPSGYRRERAQIDKRDQHVNRSYYRLELIAGEDYISFEGGK